MLTLLNQGTRLGTKHGYKGVTRFNDKLVRYEKELKIFLGNKWSAVPTGKLRVDSRGSAPTHVILSSRSLKLGSVSDVGATMPSTAVQSGLAMIIRAWMDYNEHVASTIRDMDGSFDTLVPLDFAQFNDALVTPRIFRNIFNSLPVMQQQAALNLPLIVNLLDNPDSEYAELANRYGEIVGGRWDDLSARVFAGPGLNTGFGIPGVVHLMGDVPDAVEIDLTAWFLEKTSPRSMDEFRQKLIRIGGAAELAKQSALGALQGSQAFIDDMEKRSSIFSWIKMKPARIFLQEEAVTGAVAERDRLIESRLQTIFAARGIDIKAAEISTLLSEGATEARSEARQVYDIAVETSPTLAKMNVASAEERV